MNQFHRTVTIQIAEGTTNTGTALQVQNLRVSFHIKKTSTSECNTASIQIYNLNKDDREHINGLPLNNLVIVKAGYIAKDQEIIFVGNTLLSSINIERPNVITKIEAQDGKFAMNQLKFSITYQAGTFAVKILKDILNKSKSGLDVNHVDWSQITDRQYKNGFCFQGEAKVLLTNVCNYLEAEWSIQNNQMKIFPSGKNNTAQIIYLTPETGLIGSPEKLLDDSLALHGTLRKKETTKEVGVTGKKYRKTIGGGYKFKSLLQPFVEPGSVIQVKCDAISDLKFRVVEVEHIGDTHGNDWYSIINGMIMQ